jgi:hypothetical protein
MTYMIRARRQPRRRLTGMSGLVDDMIDQYSNAVPGYSIDPTVMLEAQCVTKAVSDGQTFKSKIDNLDATWNPTGFFPPDDVRAVISSTMELEAHGRAAIDKVQTEAHVRTDLLNRARDGLDRAGARAIDYLDAAREADSKGVRLVNAPGLKQWVIDTMNAASAALIVGQAVDCLKPWWLSALQAYQDAFDVAITHVVAIAGSVLAVGENAVKVAFSLLEHLNLLILAGLGVGGYLVWKKHFK